MFETREAERGGPGGLATASAICGVVAFAVFVLGHGDVRTVPVTFASAIAAVVMGVAAMRRAKGVRSASRWVAGGGIGLGLSFLVVVNLIYWNANRGHGGGGNESSVLGQMRSLIAAEHEYRERVGQGNFCSLACLATPALCVPGYTGAPFLMEPFVHYPEQPHSGYRRTFHAGVVAPGPAVLSPEGRLATFAYTAVPVKVGITGVRGFCADSTERICFTVEGTVPPVKDGLCDPACSDLR
jgi:hypothetical protein